MYLSLVKTKLQIMIEYREAFIGGVVAQMASYGAEFTLIWILIGQFKTIGGWLPYECMFLYAVNLASYGLAGFFFCDISYKLPLLVRSGEFDEVLTKPLDPLLYLTCREFNYAYFSHLSLSMLVLGLCVAKLGISFTPAKLVFLAVTILSGALIHAAAFLFIGVSSFWLVQNSGLSTFLGSLRTFMRYPLSAYNQPIQIFLTLVIPYAFISFYPAQLFLSKNDFLMFHPVFQYLSPLVGGFVFALTYGFWNMGLRHYESTGS